MIPTLPRPLPFGVRHVSGDRIVAMLEIVSRDNKSTAPRFGAGLPTSPKRPTAGLLCHGQRLLVELWERYVGGITGDLRSDPCAGSGDPRTTRKETRAQHVRRPAHNIKTRTQHLREFSTEQ